MHVQSALQIYAYIHLSYDVASESEITPCIKIDKSLAVYRFLGNVMKMTLLTSHIWQNPNVFTPKL